MSEKKLGLDSDLTLLTDEELTQLQQACWKKGDDVNTERSRRQALPWVWANEEATVTAIRAALKKPAHRGEDKPEPWVAPTSPLDAYITGDRVTHKDSTWAATGKGMLTAEPGTHDPIQGEVWRAENTTGEVTPDEELV